MDCVGVEVRVLCAQRRPSGGGAGGGGPPAPGGGDEMGPKAHKFGANRGGAGVRRWGGGWSWRAAAAVGGGAESAGRLGNWGRQEMVSEGQDLWRNAVGRGVA